ncbi:MAG: glycosyltransferase family 4 protein [Candidatus Rokubacteria bacterium]|nr:glycosyltransferase family 4 protein [Candidatus Rokubacteria bacterium]
MPGRVALLTPFAPPSVRGNAVTVARVARGLRARGVELRVWDLSVTPEAAVEAAVEAYRPALVHAFHAWRVGPLALRLARRAELPLVVTLTGTDANLDLFDPERAPAVRRVLESAARLTVFHASIAERVAGALPDLRARIVVVPQAVSLARGERFDLSARWPLPPGRVLFVFPAGLREVKRPRLPLGPLDRVVARRPEVRLLYAGPILDPDEGDALLRALAARPWARHVGAVPHAQMASLLEQADVVLNCSRSEGGMANSILESLALGRAVLASDVEGNHSLVEDGVTGLLFRDEAELAANAERLAADPALRARLGAAGRALVLARYPEAREIDGYLDVYRRLVPVTA